MDNTISNIANNTNQQTNNNSNNTNQQTNNTDQQTNNQSNDTKNKTVFYHMIVDTQLDNFIIDRLAVNRNEIKAACGSCYNVVSKGGIRSYCNSEKLPVIIKSNNNQESVMYNILTKIAAGITAVTHTTPTEKIPISQPRTPAITGVFIFELTYSNLKIKHILENITKDKYDELTKYKDIDLIIFNYPVIIDNNEHEIEKGIWFDNIDKNYEECKVAYINTVNIDKNNAMKLLNIFITNQTTLKIIECMYDKYNTDNTNNTNKLIFVDFESLLNQGCGAHPMMQLGGIGLSWKDFSHIEKLKYLHNKSDDKVVENEKYKLMYRDLKSKYLEAKNNAGKL